MISSQLDELAVTVNDFFFIFKSNNIVSRIDIKINAFEIKIIIKTCVKILY